MSRPLRHGFTLVELLVATAVFVIGFAAVFTLFLSGMRFRKLADDTVLTSTLASSLLTEIYLDSAMPLNVGPAEPAKYDGGGLGVAEAPLAAWRGQPLYSYAGVPGTAYRIAGPPSSTAPTGGTANGDGHCCDLAGGQDPMTTAIVADIVALRPGAPAADLGELERRLRLFGGSGPPVIGTADDQAVLYQNELVARGIAMRYRAVLIRQPHWLRP